ncbi:hypothetical protein [Methylocucumis oryzae]|uniref:hypothetical protein n=1 Tax=Methylocucumis oryzae TaxID=1632867 RepID=UPI00103C9D69|nr:hypothetical protein [Methylocucumis oryzae]
MLIDQSCLQVNRRRFLKILSFISVASWFEGLAGCNALGPIRIAGHTWPGYEFLFLARDMGWMKPEDTVFGRNPKRY